MSGVLADFAEDELRFELVFHIFATYGTVVFYGLSPFFGGLILVFVFVLGLLSGYEIRVRKRRSHILEDIFPVALA